MHILKTLEINQRLMWIYIQIAICFVFILSNTWSSIVNDHDFKQETLFHRFTRFRRESPSTGYSLISVLGHPMKNNSTSSSSAVFCSSNLLSYPLKSIVVNNDGSINGITLTVQGRENSIISTAKARGLLFIFNDLPISSCYILNFSSKNSVDMNKLKVQFIYNVMNYTADDTRRAYESGYGYGNNMFYPSIVNQNLGCGSTICQNGGICRYMDKNGYQCQCDSSGRWLGIDCSKPNPCMWSPCANGGQCYYYSDATYYCICSPGYAGSNCQSSLSSVSTNSNNPCLLLRPCLNGGVCSSSNNQAGYTCTCSQGYSGVNCQSSSSNYVTNPKENQSNKCGISSLKYEPSLSDYDRIVGGTPVKDHTWPWIVSIQTMYGGSHFCGGTLVDAYHVITAAHCFDAAGTSPENFKIVAGLHNMRQSYATGVQQLTVDRIYRHEQYSSTALINDITVIKLRTPAQFNAFVSPICLPNGNNGQDPKVRQNVLIAGWGYTDSRTKQIANQLQQATIQILDINGDLYGGPGCNAWIRRGYTINNGQQICAMSLNTRSDSCQGDSGGPLIGTVGSNWYLFGIVSYGDAICGSSTAAGVYTRVSGYATWIQQKLRL